MSTTNITPMREGSSNPEPLPEWLSTTPEESDHAYNLTMFIDADAAQNLDLTREEYEWLKQSLAVRRGLVVPIDAGPEPKEDRARYTLFSWKRDAKGDLIKEQVALRGANREALTARVPELLSKVGNLDDMEQVCIASLIELIQYRDCIFEESGSNWVGEFLGEILLEVAMAGPEGANHMGPEMRDDIAESLADCYEHWTRHVEEMEDIEELYPGLSIVQARAATDTNAPEEPAQA